MIYADLRAQIMALERRHGEPILESQIASAYGVSQIVAISAILERQREADLAGDREAFHSADEASHAAIADAGGYPGIWKMVQQVTVRAVSAAIVAAVLAAPVGDLN